MNTENKILIVDDDIDICYMMQKIMHSEHFSSQCSDRIEGVFELVHQYDPGMIFIDNQLPDGLGVDQIRGLKDSFPKLKVVLLTGDSRPGLKELAEHNGADLFVSKPFTMAKIKDVLKLFLAGDLLPHAA